MDFYVYEHWRSDTNRPFYVGKGHGTRAQNMHRRNRYHKNITAKVGRGNIQIRMVAQGLTEEAALYIEADRIKLWRSMKVKLANMVDSGGGRAAGFKASPETKKKMSEAKKGKPHTPEHRMNIRTALKARRR